MQNGKMKKAAAWIGIILILFLTYFFGTGLMKNTSVYIDDFSASEDGKSMTISVSVASSLGYVRDVTVHPQNDGRLLITCHSAFGGLNGRIGAKDEFTVSTSENTSMISVYRGKDQYEDVLMKDENGQWHKLGA